MAKKYSINMENDEIVSIEVNGVQYKSLDQIPDPDDRAQVLKLMQHAPDEFEDMNFDNHDFESFTAQPSFDLTKIFIPLFLGIAILMLVITAISAFSTIQALSKEQTAPGHVVELVVRRGSDGQEFYYPIVEFSLPDHQIQRVQLSEGSWPPAYYQGEAVTIAYDPARPLDSRIKSTSSLLGMWILPIITGFLGVAFLVATLVARWVLQQDPAETPEGMRMST